MSYYGSMPLAPAPPVAPAPAPPVAPAPAPPVAPAPAPAIVLASLLPSEQMDEGHLMDSFQISEIDNNLLDIIDPALFTTQAERDSIELFVKTYSAYHIRTFTQAQKESLKQRLWHNQVLVTLITNLDKPKLYAVNYLEGPVSFKLFQFNNKTVYLFGEYHKNTIQDCYRDIKPSPPYIPYGTSIRNVAPGYDTLRLNEFIELLSFDTPSFFDFYLETGTDDFYKIHQTTDFNTTRMFIYIFYGLTIGQHIIQDTQFIDYINGGNILSELNRIAYDFSVRNSLALPVSTGIIYDQQLIDDLQSYYISNRNISLYNIVTLPFEMFQTRDKFRSCFQPNTRKNVRNDDCRLGRFHHVDARTILPDNRNVLEPLQIILIIQTSNLHNLLGYPYTWILLLERIGIIPFLQKILDTSTGTPEENLFNHIIDMYPLVNKEWNGSYYKQEIKDFFKSKLKDIDISQVSGIHTLINLDAVLNDALRMFNDVNATTTNASIYISTRANILDAFFIACSFIMDIYCLSRVFKKFKIKTDCQPEQTNNIIIYAGDAHISIYSEFIVSLGNPPLYQRKNNSYSCIELGFNSTNPISNLNIA